MGLEFTRTELKAAIRDIMQDDEVVEALLQHLPLPVVTERAGAKAFLEELTGPPVEIIREALKMLQSPGWFHFQPEEGELGPDEDLT